jgi:hypothetical protein
MKWTNDFIENETNRQTIYHIALLFRYFHASILNC